MLGPVSAQELLQEAKWATAVYAKAQTLPQAQRNSYFKHAHQLASHTQLMLKTTPLSYFSKVENQTPEAFSHAYDLASKTTRSANSRKAHLFLSRGAPQPLGKLYAYVFERLLGQQISHVQQQLKRIHEHMTLAVKQNRPVLFVLNSIKPLNRTRNPTLALQRRLMNEFEVLHVRANERPALSQITNLPPLESRTMTPMLVMRSAGTDLECMRIINGRPPQDIDNPVRSMPNGIVTNISLAQSLVEYYKGFPPKIADLIRIHRLLKKVDIASAKEFERVIAADREREQTRGQLISNKPKQKSNAEENLASVR